MEFAFALPVKCNCRFNTFPRIRQNGNSHAKLRRGCQRGFDYPNNTKQNKTCNFNAHSFTCWQNIFQKHLLFFATSVSHTRHSVARCCVCMHELHSWAFPFFFIRSSPCDFHFLITDNFSLKQEKENGGYQPSARVEQLCSLPAWAGETLALVLRCACWVVTCWLRYLIVYLRIHVKQQDSRPKKKGANKMHDKNNICSYFDFGHVRFILTRFFI